MHGSYLLKLMDSCLAHMAAAGAPNDAGRAGSGDAAGNEELSAICHVLEFFVCNAPGVLHMRSSSLLYLLLRLVYVCEKRIKWGAPRNIKPQPHKINFIRLARAAVARRVLNFGT